jgi:glycosyltransferase involved in cell wall biosynthesis
MASLYLCYQGILEPLTQTQVVPYLEGLAQAGYRMVLLTFETRSLTAAEVAAWRESLRKKGIHWHWCRYHKWPTVPATAYDVLVGILMGFWLVLRYRVQLLHARVHVPGLMALVLQRLTGAKLLFDIRGFMAEEYVDSGRWKAGGILFRVTKRVERALMRAADGFVILTSKGKELLEQWYPHEIRDKPLEVIPCCVDFRCLPPAGTLTAANAGRRGPPILAYVGKLGGWYLTEEMTAFAAAALRQIPGARWRVWTQSDPAPLQKAAQARDLGGLLEIGCLPPAELAGALSQVHAGLSFIKPCLSKRASSATKVSEYLAAGLPVVATAGIGDTDAILLEPSKGSRPVGVLVRDFTPEAYREATQRLNDLLADAETPARCRAAAEAHYDLEQVGWVRYRRLYQQLLGKGT